MTGISVSRENVLGYRARGQGLDRSGSLDGLLGIGVQDTPAGTALTALAARGVTGLPPKTRIVWSWRGAPHVHPRCGPDLPEVRARSTRLRSRRWWEIQWRVRLRHRRADRRS